MKPMIAMDLHFVLFSIFNKMNKNGNSGVLSLEGHTDGDVVAS